MLGAEELSTIKNKQALLSHGNKKGREIVLDLINHAIMSVNSYSITKKLIRVENHEKLIVGNLKYDLSKMGNIYVLGAGKATLPIAQALDEILGQRINKGIIIVKKGQRLRLRRIKVAEAAHPIPNKAGLKGAKEIMEIASEAKEGDLVFCAITGGASALMPLPAQGVTLEDLKKLTDLLLKCGATVDDINTVRKHVSAISGGRLAMQIHPAEIVNLIVIDEVANQPWGPTVPDTTTFSDAILVLKKYNIWKKAPASIRKYLKKGVADSIMETPKPKEFEGLKLHNIILANNQIACETAKRRAEALGFNSSILSTVLEGESREVGTVLASIAKEIEENERPVRPPCALIIGGETTVTITKEASKGGPSQELALSFAMKIGGSKKIVSASVDTDGTDGPTDVAGGIVDGYTIERTKEKGIDLHQSLMKHDSLYVLERLRDAIITGPTGTNVMDLNVIVILA